MWGCDAEGMSQSTDASTDEILLDAYDWDGVHSKDTYEHEQLYELEGFVGMEHLPLLSD